MNKEYYLDNGATTAPYPEVVDKVAEISKFCYGNSSSIHKKGIEAEKEVNKSKKIIAELSGVNENEIFFTSGGTESNNMAISGCISANYRKGKHLITTKIEHSAVLEVFKHYESAGYDVNYINVDNNGIVNIDELKRTIRPDTVLVSVMAVNNETGCIQPIQEIGSFLNAMKNKPYFHVDAVQAFGKMIIRPDLWRIDMMSVSAHKLHGPKGVGALYIKTGTKIKPVMWGGGHQAGMRSGTLNTPGISGFGLAAEIIHKNMKANSKNFAEMRKILITGLKENFENIKIHSENCSLDQIVCISFDGLKGEVLMHHLETKGIYVSTGSACSSNGKHSTSHVLNAMNIKPDLANGTIRISFSEFNVKEDMLVLIKALQEIVPVITIKNKNKIRR